MSLVIQAMYRLMSDQEQQIHFTAIRDVTSAAAIRRRVFAYQSKAPLHGCMSWDNSLRARYSKMPPGDLTLHRISLDKVSGRTVAACSFCGEAPHKELKDVPAPPTMIPTHFGPVPTPDYILDIYRRLAALEALEAAKPVKKLQLPFVPWSKDWIGGG